MNKHNYLFLIWKDPRSRRNYTVGKLSRNGHFTFEYCEEYKEAVEAGWSKLVAFPEVKKYESETLFGAFSSRLPDPKRNGIDNILKKYGLDEYDGYELLRKSTGRLPIDTYEFIDPIFPDEEVIQRDFYIMGIRHNSACDGHECSMLPKIKMGENLTFVSEPDNPSDKYAIKVMTHNGEMLGYVPRYYSESISYRLLQKQDYSCSVIDINQSGECEDCIKVRLIIPV